MGPVKFDDLAKATTEVLNDDYQVSGHQLKAKQKTALDGAVVTSAIDLWTKDCATPAKLTWKFPKPFGIAGLCVDKLEMDKGGKFKFEAVIDKALHQVDNLKVELKSDLADVSKASGGVTYTGVADTQLKFETKPDGNFTAEATRTVNDMTLGVKLGKATLTAPDLGIKYQAGLMTAAILAKEKLSVFSGSVCYKVSDDLKVAGTFEQGKATKYTAGLAYNVQKGTSVKAKYSQDTKLSFGVKHQMSPGVTLLMGMSYDLIDISGKHSYGWQLSIE